MKFLRHLLVLVIALAGLVGIGFFLHLLPETGIGERLGTDAEVLPAPISDLYPAIDSPGAYVLITLLVVALVAAAVIMGVIRRRTAPPRKDPTDGR